MHKLNFHPWIGNYYSTTGFAGKRILALGESHYCEKASDATEDITRKVIADLFDPQSEHEAYKNTYTKFAEALLGRDCLSFEDKERFWNSIAFYNYVQVPMTGARVAPSQKDFNDSEAAFFEVLESLRPDIVIVWEAACTTTFLRVDSRETTLGLLTGTGWRPGDISSVTARK